jgi:hypothetical protein
MKRVLLVVLVACSSKQGPSTTGSGSVVINTPPATGCDGAKVKVEQLYRADASAKGEKAERVAEFVSDNTQMVMNECVKSPDKVVACINKVASASELEKSCLAPLDEEGTEGEALRK